MSENDNKPGGNLLIVDNSDADWKVKRYLQDCAKDADDTQLKRNH